MRNMKEGISLKINVNYDLIEKISISKKGYALKKNIKIISCFQGVSFGIAAAGSIALTKEYQMVLSLLALKHSAESIITVIFYNILS